MVTSTSTSVLRTAPSTCSPARSAAAPSPALAASIKASLATLAKTNVDVYGAIYLKTDGERLITAFKIEEQSETDRWFYYEYAFTPGGELVLIN